MGVYANGVGDEERFSVLKKALVALALLGVMAVVASPAQAQESTINTITVNSLNDVTNPGGRRLHANGGYNLCQHR